MGPQPEQGDELSKLKAFSLKFISMLAYYWFVRPIIIQNNKGDAPHL